MDAHSGLQTLDRARFVSATRVAGWAALVLASAVLAVGWGLSVDWVIGLVADGWPVTTPWTATLFVLLAAGALAGGDSPGALRGGASVASNAAAVVVASALLALTAVDLRGGIELALFRDQLLELGGRYPGMPSIQSLTTAVFLGLGSLLVTFRRMPRTRTVLLTTALLTGVSATMTTAASAADLRIGSAVYGFSITTGLLTLLTVVAVSGIAADAAPAAVLRTRPLQCMAAVGVAGILGIPAVNLLVETVRDDGGTTGLVFAAVLFFTLALSLSWITWYAMRAEGWRAVAEFGTDAVVVLDPDAVIRDASTGITELTGWSPGDLRGTKVSEVLLGAGAGSDLFTSYLKDPMSPLVPDAPVSVRTRDGRSASLAARLVPTMSAEGPRVFAMLNDATREAEYRRRSMHDPLTGVLNRAGTMHFLTASMDADPEHTAVLYIDVDKFKRINDEVSHAAGDEALRALATNLDRGVRSVDRVGRIGGDEFVCVLTRMSDRRQLDAVASRVIEAVEPTSVVADGTTLPVRISIGAACGRPDEEPEDILARADHALRAAKQAGRNRIEFADDCREDPTSEVLQSVTGGSSGPES